MVILYLYTLISVSESVSFLKGGGGMGDSYFWNLWMLHDCIGAINFSLHTNTDRNKHDRSSSKGYIVFPCPEM